MAGCSSTTSSVESTESSAASAVDLIAYITNSQDNGKTTGMGSVIPIGLSDMVTGMPIDTGEGTGPNDIIITADGTTAWVTNEYTNSVASIDLATGVVGPSIAVGAEPVAIAFVPGSNEQWAWTSNYDGKSVTTINLATGSVGTTIKMPNAGPNTIAFTPDGKYCYVANWGTSSKAGSTVTPIQVTDGGAGGTIMPNIKVGLNPNWIAVTPDGATAYVAKKGSSSITPIDVATNTAGAAINVPGPPIELEISPDGALAYVAIAGSAPEIDAVVPMDLTVSPATVGATIAMAPKSQPHWIAFTPDGLLAYVVGNGDSTLTPITVAGNTPGTPAVLSTDPDADMLAIAITAKK
ncbi:MAG: hypothetical protein Q7K25_01325 [Actinomycetota bacterium]|nr:hypothetical protein [Actinomycetota bacterium]